MSSSKASELRRGPLQKTKVENEGDEKTFLVGNVYGSSKRASGNGDQIVYEYFEGSTNKVRQPLKFSTLLEMFSPAARN